MTQSTQFRSSEPEVATGGTDRRVVNVDLDRLHFDPQNPRLPRSIDRESEMAVIDWMLTDATLLELMGSIAEQGYFPGEPILITPERPGFDDPQADEFIVVEGNRRLAAAKLLRNPSITSKRVRSVRELSEQATHSPPDALPCLIFTKRADTLNYLGFRHVTGIKEWEPLAKARYLREMYDVRRRKKMAQKVALKDIALTIGSRTDYVARLLTSLYILDYIIGADFFDIDGLDEDSIEFSLLSTAVSYKSIASFVGLESPSQVEVRRANRSNLEQLVGWMFSTGDRVVGESRQIRQLAAVVKKPRAIAELRRSSSLERAVLLTDEPYRVFRKTLGQARERLLLAQSQVHLVETLTEEDESDLREIGQLTRDLRATIRSRLDDEV